jgi:aldehyde:ferredoxin oxidoreductase
MLAFDLAELKSGHKELARFVYEPVALERGYANRTLHVNLSDYSITPKPVTEEMKRIFTGGRGFGLYYLWHAVTPETKWNDPENAVIMGCGPLGGTMQYPGAGKSLVVSLSPATGIPIDSNVGGHFGPLLKFSGWDILELRGKAQEEVFVVVDGDHNTITIETAPYEAIDSHILAEQISQMYAKDRDDRHNISSVSAGRGSDHTWMGCLNFSYWDWRRGHVRIKQAGRGGIGTVFRDKKVKALVVKRSQWRPKWHIER